MKLEIKRRFNEKDLPDMKSLTGAVDTLHQAASVGQTLFLKHHGVKSEGEFKKRCAAEGRVMKHSQIGWNSCEATLDGFRHIYGTLEESGSYIDRFGISLDWIMGVPEDVRHKFPIGTGLVLKTPEDWAAVGQAVPVQPHFGDHMIGSLNSVENTRLALGAGVTTIGNISQYYTYDYPGLDRERERTEEMVKAVMLMGRFYDLGAIVHSNLDDGYGSLFHDVTNMVGWAMLERHLIEDLMGAGLGQCYGNLFSDPMLRIIFNRAIAKANPRNTPGSMVNGNTIDYSTNIPRNFGVMGAYTLADAICQMKYPTGHAISPIPVTEAVRIPSVDEIIEGHRVIDLMMEKAPYYSRFIDWDKVEAEAELLVTCGRIFFERVMNGLDDMRVDITHPGELLCVLKGIGPEQLEVNFGVGRSDQSALRGRVPVRPTSIIQTISELKNKLVGNQKSKLAQTPLKGITVVMGSSDVHELGKEVCKTIIQEAGATVFDLGATVAPEEFVDTIRETDSRVVMISTYNGIALSYAEELLKIFRDNGLNVKLLMGGLLNENMEGRNLPVDVSKELIELGVNCNNNAEKLVEDILEAVKSQ